MPSYVEYLDYQVEDFVMDSGFQQWVRQPSPTADRYWEQFLATYPDKRELLDEARKIIENINYRPRTLSAERQERILQEVYRRVDPPASGIRLSVLRLLRSEYRAVAAGLILLLLSFLAYQVVLNGGYDTYETGNQENQTIHLADGSTVSLNANTRLKIKIDLEADAPREVWLEGEAYFQVKRLDSLANDQLPNLRTFVVHTGNLDIEVLGTSFNVSSRPTRSEVLLNSGKVKVASPQIRETQILQPGDLLSLSEVDHQFHLRKTEPDTAPNWRNNLFIFNQTTLSEVARAIEDYYGLEVEITTQELASRTFSAKVSRDELPLLLEAIEMSFEVNAIQEGQRIRIAP